MVTRFDAGQRAQRRKRRAARRPAGLPSASQRLLRCPGRPDERRSQGVVRRRPLAMGTNGGLSIVVVGGGGFAFDPIPMCVMEKLDKLHSSRCRCVTGDPSHPVEVRPGADGAYRSACPPSGGWARRCLASICPSASGRASRSIPARRGKPWRRASRRCRQPWRYDKRHGNPRRSHRLADPGDAEPRMVRLLERLGRRTSLLHHLRRLQRSGSRSGKPAS